MYNRGYYIYSLVYYNAHFSKKKNKKGNHKMFQPNDNEITAYLNL